MKFFMILLLAPTLAVAAPDGQDFPTSSVISKEKSIQFALGSCVNAIDQEACIINVYKYYKVETK